MDSIMTAVMSIMMMMMIMMMKITIIITPHRRVLPPGEFNGMIQSHCSSIPKVW